MRLAEGELVEAAACASNRVGLSAACQALGLARATYYRRRKVTLSGAEAASGQLVSEPAVLEQSVSEGPTPSQCRVPGRALSMAERQSVLDELHSERFMDKAVPQVWATLLEEGVYLCSISTMYRLLRERGESVERRRLRTHPPASRPELLATGPNQVWSWDITKLKGPRKWSYFYLYVILDVFSRFVVGWCIAEREKAEIAEALIQETVHRENVVRDTLTLHADRGSAMTSTTVAELLIDLGVSKSHSRPHTSNDNPFSESHFKTLKYRPQMPERFGCVEDARIVVRELLHWYNHDHRHSGLALFTPATVHTGKAAQATKARASVLECAFGAHPERFVNQAPAPPSPPTQVWINPPLVAPAKEEVAATA